MGVGSRSRWLNGGVCSYMEMPRFRGESSKEERQTGGCDRGYPAQHSIKASANLWLRCKFQLPESLKDDGFVCLFILIHSSSRSFSPVVFGIFTKLYNYQH